MSKYFNENSSPIELSNELRSKFKNIWRCADSGKWDVMKNSNRLTFAWLDKKVDYSKNLNKMSGQGKRSIFHWVNDLSKGDLIFVMDKKKFYGVCIAESKYKFRGVSIYYPEYNDYKPAIKVKYLFKLDSPIEHGFIIPTQRPATFAKIDDYGFDLKDTLQFLQTKIPESTKEILNTSKQIRINTGGYIDLTILPSNPNTKTITVRGISNSGNPNYEKEARKLKKLGARGEKIVMKFEKKRLNRAGRKDLAEKIERVSLKSDAFGYDILSFETDGKKRFIEVKATRSKVGAANFFYTANELQTALKSDNYFIYMVYDVSTKSPKVWSIINPFNPKNKNVVMTPINYRIAINAKVNEKG